MDEKSNQQGSGSDTVSAAKISGGASGSSPQSSTLASQTSKPLGGGAGPTGAGQSHSQGPEHLRHQDKDMGRGDAGRGASGGGSGSGARQSAAQSAAETVRETADQVRERGGEAYEQASEWARDTYEQAAEYASDMYERGTRYLGSARRSMPRMGQARSSVERFVSENPLLVGVVGLAAGLLIGALLPRTRHEDRTFGRLADEVREQGMRYARDMAHRGREMVDELLGDQEEEESDWRREERERRGVAGRFQNH